MPKQAEFEQRIAVIADLVERLERAVDPGLRAIAQELVQALMVLHGAGLERLLQLVGQNGVSGPAAIEQFGRDPLIRSLLLLHGLHPADLRTRIQEGLDQARPYLNSHGGNVELVSVDEVGAVRLRMQGSCHGCPSSAMTLKLAIEDAIREAAPDVTSIVVEGQNSAERPELAALAALASKGAAQLAGIEDVVWEEIPELTDLPEGAMGMFAAGERSLLCCRMDDTLYAYGDRCPGCGGELSQATLTGTALACPVCGESYDMVLAGRGLDRPDLHLDPFPLLRKNGRARVALPLMRMELGSV